MKRDLVNQIEPQAGVDVKSMVMSSLFAALIAVGAFIQIPLPNTDYFTLQLFFVILSGMIMGSKKGFISVGIYLLAGLLGFPVFAAGGGIGYILRPTFGYLLGFLFAAWASGKVVELTGGDTYKKMLLAAFTGFFIIYAVGFTYKYFILNVYSGIPTPWIVVIAGAFPIDIPSDIFLCFFASGFALRIRKLLPQYR